MIAPGSQGAEGPSGPDSQRTMLMVVTLLVLVLVLVMVTVPRSVNEGIQPTATPEPTPVATADRPFQVTLGGVPLEDVTPTLVTEPLSRRDPADIVPSQVHSVRSSGGQTRLVMTDGSEMIVTRFVLEDLPGSLRTRIEYSRER